MGARASSTTPTRKNDNISGGLSDSSAIAGAAAKGLRPGSMPSVARTVRAPCAVVIRGGWLARVRLCQDFCRFKHTPRRRLDLIAVPRNPVRGLRAEDFDRILGYLWRERACWDWIRTKSDAKAGLGLPLADTHCNILGLFETLAMLVRR